MCIEKIEIQNFKCFGKKVIFNIKSGKNAFVGDNGTGKTTVLEALNKVFKETNISIDDFHIGRKNNTQNNTREKDNRAKQMFIDVTICIQNSDVATSVSYYIFKAIDSLKFRIRLEAENTDGQDYDNVEYKFYAVYTDEDIPFGSDIVGSEKRPISKRDLRLFIEYVYIPAQRDGKSITTRELKRLLKRIENDIEWDEEFPENLTKSAKKLQNDFENFEPIRYIQNEIIKNYKTLYDLSHENNPKLAISQTEFYEVLRSINLFFESTFISNMTLEDLSEGQISLLYLALSITYHRLIHKLHMDEEFRTKNNFKNKPQYYPALLLFGVEEPENHLSPFYLSRIIQQFDSLKGEMRVQTLFTSHSTSILRHLDYQHVTFLRRCLKNGNCFAREIVLNNEQGNEDTKFIKEAIENNPEIYFARLMIIGEGDSEKVVIPKIAKAFGLDLDTNFVAFVSIGGRHAYHLWRLANMLDIPCITLLDYDEGRHQGGEGRLKNADSWLQKAKITVQPDDTKTQTPWEKYEKNHFVYYSYPIDLDMMMIQNFPEDYKHRDTKVSDKDLIRSLYKDSVANRLNDDFSLDNSESIADLNIPIRDRELLKAYKVLFDSKSKVVSHQEALHELSNDYIKDNCPDVLKRLVEDAHKKLFIKPEKKSEEREGSDKGDIQE